MVADIIILIASFTARAHEIQTLENLFHFSMHFLWRIPSQALGLVALPAYLSCNAIGAVETVAVLALHGIGLNDVRAKTADKQVNCACHRRVLADAIGFWSKHLDLIIRKVPTTF